MSNTRLGLLAVLVILGVGWGLTQPLTKITVTHGYQPLGLVFWQLAIGTVVLAALRWRQLRRIPVTRATVAVWVVIALLGTVIPNSASYRAAMHLPAGVMSIVISAVPILAFPIALALRTDHFSWRRMAGLLLGLCGVALIALPESSLPDRAMVAFLPLALIAPFCYALEGNIVARWGTAGLDPLQTLLGASAIGTMIALPLALGSGQFIVPRAPFVLADLTMLLTSLIHVSVYTGYVWLIGRAGAVYAGQVAYVVTGAGVVWAMILLGESYSLWVWAALVAICTGMTLVRPRLAAASPISQDAAYG